MVLDAPRTTAVRIARGTKRSKKVGLSTRLPCFAIASVLAETDWMNGVEGGGFARLAIRIDLWCTEKVPGAIRTPPHWLFSRGREGLKEPVSWSCLGLTPSKELVEKAFQAQDKTPAPLGENGKSPIFKYKIVDDRVLKLVVRFGNTKDHVQAPSRRLIHQQGRYRPRPRTEGGGE